MTRALMTNADRLDILKTAFDNVTQLSDAEIEAAALDPYRPDVLKRWNNLRPKPEPAPRHVKLDTHRSIEAICDARVAPVYRAIEDTNSVLLEAVGDFSGQMRAELRTEIAALRRDLKSAREEIKALQADKSKSDKQIVGWKLDRKKYKAIPFMSDGKPGMPINLRPLFEQYHDETAT